MAWIEPRQRGILDIDSNEPGISLTGFPSPGSEGNRMEHWRIVEGLESREAYPFDVDDIELIQTEISSVILAGEFAYKLKKPVRLDFVDFSTLEKRLHFCGLEVDLNRRLVPEIYLGVVPVVAEGRKLRIEKTGEPLEYAVKMRRLPDERMMNVLLEGDQVGPSAVDEIAGVVSDFHRRTESGPEIAGYGAPDRLERELEDDLAQVEALTGTTASAGLVAEAGEYLRSWLQGHRRLLEQRVASSRVRDCHGDMHSRNICLPDAVDIFDCIEFNDAFRYIDVAREVAFLAMDLDFYDQPALSERYVEKYVELSGDHDLEELLVFYKAWLALVRGKVYSIPLTDADVSLGERKYSTLRAARYFELANRYAGGRGEPLVLVLMGVMGSGKTALARELAKRLNVHVLDSDFIRKNLAGIEPEERREVGFGEGIYSPEMTERVYRAMADATESMTRAGYSVILDASFAKKKHREKILRLAAESDFRVLFIECTAPRDVLESRLTDRERRRGDYSDGRPELLARQLEEYEDPLEIPPEIFMKLDTEIPPGELADFVIDRVERSGAVSRAGW